MTDTILNLDDLNIPFASRGTARVIDGDISLPTDFATAYSGMIGASNLNGRTLTISGLTQDDTIGVTGGGASGSYSIVGNYVQQGPTLIAEVTRTSTSVSFTFIGVNSASFDAFFQSLTFRTTDDRAFSTRDLTFSLNTPTFPQTGTVKITIGEEPPVIGGLDDATIAFETRFVRNVIDSDITLPTSFTNLFDETNTLNGRTLTITGTQPGDAIRFAEGSGFVLGYPNTTLNGQTIATTAGNAYTTTFTFTSAITTAHLEQMLQAMTFQAGSLSPAESTRTLSFSLDTPTPLTGTVNITLSAPEERNLIGDLDDQVVSPSGGQVALDTALLLSVDFVEAYSTPGSLNNLTMAITGWTGQQIPVGTVEGSGVSILADAGFFSNVYVDGTQIGVLNSAAGTFFFNTAATPALVERLLEGLTILPQIGSTGSQTITITITTPVAPQFGTVTFTAAPFDLTNLRDVIDTTLRAAADGIVLDSDVSVTGQTSWRGGEIEITGLSQGDQIVFTPNAGLSFNPETGEISTSSVLGTLTMSGTTATITLSSEISVSTSGVDAIIEGLTLVSYTEGTRNLTLSVTNGDGVTLSDTIRVNIAPPPVQLTGLRETVDVSYNTVINEGLLLDSNVTLTGEGPWEGGKIEVTGLGEGDSLMFTPASGSRLYISDEGMILGTRGGGFEPEWFLEIAALPTTSGSTYTITLGGISTQEVETIIESLRLTQATSGARTLTISVSDASGFVVSDDVTVNVGYIPTLTDMVDTLDLTATEAADGQLLDADVSFRADSDLEFGWLAVDGVGAGEEVVLRSDDGSPITLAGSTVLIDGREVGTLRTYEGGPQIAFTEETTAKDVEAMIENLLFRTTAPSSVASRDITIMISDTDGETDMQVVTVNLLPAGSKEMSYQILQTVNGSLVPVENGTGTTGDLNAADLFGTANPPDDFVVQYSGLLTVGQSTFGEKSVIAFGNVAPGTVLVVNGVSYALEGPEGRLALDLAPGLHKITLQVPYETNMGQVVTTAPTLTLGTVIPPEDTGPWPPYDQTPLFDTVRTAPETLYRVEVTTTATIPATGDSTVLKHVFYVTSEDDIPGQLEALRQYLNLPPFLSVQQDYSVTEEVSDSGGADTLTGTDGADLLEGGAGDDLLLGSLGADTLDGGTGVNTVSYEASDARVTVDLSKGVGQGGHADGDVLRNINVVIGSRFGDNLIGSDGDDTLYGMEGRDTLIGNAGNDLLFGGSRSDSLSGGEGDDMLRGGTGNDTLLGGAGNDWLRGGRGADSLDGGEGVNRAMYDWSNAAVTVNLQTGAGTGGDAEGDVLVNIREVVGSTFGDVLTGGTFADVLLGAAGNDTIDGGRRADRLFGGEGDDSLAGGAGNDLLFGGLGADTIDGGSGIDTLSYARAAHAVVVHLGQGVGDGGNLSESEGDRILNIERVVGSGFDDTLTGGAGNETLAGGAGSDQLNGGAGNDVLIGGDGGDVFIFLESGFGSDRIEDLGADDLIVIVSSLWGTATPGDVSDLIDTYGHASAGYVELRLSETDIIRIDDVTLQDLRDNPGYFSLGG